MPITCPSHAHHMSITCPSHAHHMSITCPLLAHYLPITCPLHAHYFQPCFLVSKYSDWTQLQRVLSCHLLNIILMFEVPVMLQMKEKYANKKPYGKWLEAQVATLPDLVESVPEHLLKVPMIQSGHSPIDAVPVSPSTKGSSAEANGKANGSSNGSSSGSNGTLSSSQEGGRVGMNASNGHSKPGAGTYSCSTAFSMSHASHMVSELAAVVHGIVPYAAVLVAPSLHWQCCAEFQATLAIPPSAVPALQLPSLPACGLCTCVPCNCRPDAMLQATIPAVQDCSSLTSTSAQEQDKAKAWFVASLS